MLKPNPRHDATWHGIFGMWLGQESGALMNRIIVLIKETPKKCHPFWPWGLSKKTVYHKPGSGLSLDMESAGLLVLNFPASFKLWEIKFCVLSHPVYILLWQPERTKTTGLDKCWAELTAHTSFPKGPGSFGWGPRESWLGFMAMSYWEVWRKFMLPCNAIVPEDLADKSGKTSSSRSKCEIYVNYTSGKLLDQKKPGSSPTFKS